MTLIFSYLAVGVLLEDKKEASKIKAWESHYFLINDVLYWRSFSGPYLLSLGPIEAKLVFTKIHSGICETHIRGWVLHHRVQTRDFFWPTM